MKDDEGRSAPHLLAQGTVDIPAAVSRWLTEWDQTKTGNALSAVLLVHRHKLMDKHVHLTESIDEAVYSRCDSCGNLPNGFLWCPTLRVIAVQLGVELGVDDS